MLKGGAGELGRGELTGAPDLWGSPGSFPQEVLPEQRPVGGEALIRQGGRGWDENMGRKQHAQGACGRMEQGSQEVGPAGLKGKGTGGPGLRYPREPEMGPQAHGRSLSLTHRKPLKVRFACGNITPAVMRRTDQGKFQLG